jgi:hypothetical protein
VDLDVMCAAVEELLESFVSAASLQGRVRDASNLPAGHRACLAALQSEPAVWAVWRTNEGPVSACVATTTIRHDG